MGNEDDKQGQLLKIIAEVLVVAVAVAVLLILFYGTNK